MRKMPRREFIEIAGLGTFALNRANLAGEILRAQFASDTFTDTDLTDLNVHTPSGGGTWTTHPSYATGRIQNNRVRADLGNGLNYHSGTPASADYDVSGDHVWFSDNNAEIGLAARIDTGANTLYWFRYYEGAYTILKVVAGVETSLGSYTQAGSNTTMLFRLAGTSLKGFLGGVERISVTDGSIAAAGKAGIYYGSWGGSFTGNNGSYLDNFSADDPGGGGGGSTPRSLTLLGVGGWR